MINANFNLASITGIVIAVAGAALYALRSWRPELSRDHDLFFSAVGLLCGLILVFYGWRFDPIMQFGQVLLTGSTIFFAVENLRLRQISTEQARRSTPIVDDERPVSRVYRAEFDELEPFEEEPPRPRIRGTQDSRNSRSDSNRGETRRRPSNSSNRGTSERLGSGETSRKRRPRTEGRVNTQVTDEWDTTDNWEDTPPPRRSSNPKRPENPDQEIASKPRKRRPPEESRNQSNRDEEPTPTDYVDYKPVEYPDDDSDNSGNFDEL